MKILITGASGYIGRHVVAEAVGRGHEVLIVDPKNEEISGTTLLDVNIFQNDDAMYTTLHKPDVLLHLAWRDGFQHNSPQHMDNLSSHAVFLRNYMMSGGNNIAVMGSMHEVGYWEGEIDENTPCNPLSQYGVAKNALRQSLMLYGKEYQKNIYWLRAYYIYGDDSSGNSIFSKITNAALAGEKKFPFTSGKNKYDFIHVDILSKQIISAITQTDVTGIINVCSGEAISLGEKVEEYIKDKGYDMRLDYGSFPDRPYDSPAIWGSNKKILQILSNVA